MSLKRTFVLLLLCLVASTYIGSLMLEDPGYVRISFMNYLIETSVWFAAFVLLVLILGLSLLSFLLRRTVESGARLSHWMRSRRQRIAARRTAQGARFLAEGDWKQALRYHSYAAKYARDPLLNYLSAAQAAYALGEEKKAEELLDKALEADPESSLAVGLSRAKLELAAGQAEKSLETLLELYRAYPKHPGVIRGILQAGSQTQDWKRLTEIIAEARKGNLVPDPELKPVERMAWIGLLTQVTEDILRMEGSSRTPAALEALWSQMPSSLTHHPEVVAAYADSLIKVGEAGRAETTLRKAIDQNWDDALVALYGRIAAPNVQEQLDTVERWLKKRPDNAALLLAAGRVSLRAHAWDKARTYFEQSLAIEKNPETMGELCRLYFHGGEPEKGARLLAESVTNPLQLPDLPLPNAAPSTAS